MFIAGHILRNPEQGPIIKDIIAERYKERRLVYADYLAYLLSNQVPQETNIFFNRKFLTDPEKMAKAEEDFKYFTKLDVDSIVPVVEDTPITASAVERSMNVNVDETPAKIP